MDDVKYPPHPAAQAFPLMEGEAYERHRDDVRVNGLRIPIVLAKHDAQWMILDGRNRQRACDETGRKPRYDYFEGDLEAAIAYAVSVNVARRHLNESQRAYAAAKLAALEPGTNRKNSGKSAGVPTQAEAAALLNVGERTVREAKAVQDKGVPELGAAVESGDVAVSRAAEIARLNREQQLDALEQAKNSAPTRRSKEQRDSMMSVSLLLTESDLMGLRALCEAGDWFAEREPRARHGVKVLRKLAPQVGK
jgi:hypothetical protein